MPKVVVAIALCWIFCSGAFAGYKIHSDDDLTINSPLFITDVGLIGAPELLNRVVIDPATPADTLVITSRGTVKIDHVAIKSFGDIIVQAENALDVIGIIHSDKNIKLDTIQGDMDLDGKFKAELNIKAKSGRDLNVGKRLAERSRQGIITQVTEVTLEGVASGRYVKFIPSSTAEKSAH